MKNFLVLSVLICIAQAQLGLIQDKFIYNMSQKFIQTLYGFARPKPEELPINSLLGKVQGAVELATEIHADPTPNIYTANLLDKSKWYNESLSSVYTPTFQSISQGKPEITKKQFMGAIDLYCERSYIKLEDAKQAEIESKLDAFLKEKDGKLNEMDYNVISTQLFPKVKPFVNMIDNTKGPFQLQFTNNLEIASTVSIYQNQTGTILMGYKLDKYAQPYNNSFVIYMDASLEKDFILDYPTPVNYFEPTVENPFVFEWERFNEPGFKSIAFAFTHPREAFDSATRYPKVKRDWVHDTTKTQ